MTAMAAILALFAVGVRGIGESTVGGGLFRLLAPFEFPFPQFSSHADSVPSS
jgi:hypothetical protein